jgi:organic hydroperoxide reductase OsmC/OhrA
MHPFPHHYPVRASANQDSNVRLTAPGIAAIQSAGPVEFGGPGDLWSPESLLCASVADCFVLSFRAVARAARLNWDDLACDVVGTLDRVDGQTRFTEFAVKATLRIDSAADEAKAGKLLQKAEHTCLITNSLTAESRLDYTIQINEC